MCTTRTLAEMIEDNRARREASGRWVAASGGLEEPMLVRGTRVLYCWNTGTKKHAYINLDTDIIMEDGEFEALCGKNR